MTTTESDRDSPAPKLFLRRAMPVVCGVLLWGGLLGWGFLAQGWTGIEKVLTSFAMPVGLVWNLGIAWVLWQWFRGEGRSAWVPLMFVVILSVSGNDHFGGWLCRSIEAPPSGLVAGVDPPFDAVVLLGGATRIGREDVPELAQDGQRVMRAAQLYHAGATPLIIATGGHSVFSNQELPVSAQSRFLLQSVGVPAEAIVEIAGINTRQEMVELRKWLDRDDTPQDPRIGIVTSASHIPRAIRLAAAQGIDLVPLPTAHRGGFGPWTPTSLIPSARALERTTIACYEILARLAGQ